MNDPFGARLAAALEARGPLCVGIDPHPGLLHDWGLDDTPDGLAHFAATVVEALADRVAVLKPQSAFFERHGSRGVAVLERMLADGRAAGALMLLDAKRGDIGSTVAAYADAYLDPGSPLYADALTASPYLGFGSLDPLYAAARAGGSGVFVLAMTSNKEGPGVQLAALEDGRSVAQSIVDAAAAENAGMSPLGDLGVVVGATTGDEPLDLSALNGPVLVPGFGAQGGTPADVRRLFPGVRGVLPSSSRGVLQYGPGLTALRDAAARDLDSLRGVLD